MAGPCRGGPEKGRSEPGLKRAVDCLVARSKTRYVDVPPQNYTDQATAACRPTFADWGVSHGQCGGSPTTVISIFLDRTSLEHSHKVGMQVQMFPQHSPCAAICCSHLWTLIPWVRWFYHLWCSCTVVLAHPMSASEEEFSIESI
jgi:hypothetical protein